MNRTVNIHSFDERSSDEGVVGANLARLGRRCLDWNPFSRLWSEGKMVSVPRVVGVEDGFRVEVA
jgi:hypothetical protein